MILASQFRRVAAYDPVGLSTGIDGCRYNAQILTNLRQDNANTAAAVGQPVGMFFDDWVPNTLGADTVTNGHFTADTSGWTANIGTFTSVGGCGRVTSSGGASPGRASQSQATTAGVTYECTVDLSANANGASLGVGLNGTATTLFFLNIPAGTTGPFKFYFIATGAASFIQLRNTSTTLGHFTDWDNVTCRPIAGRHLIQQTAPARPILRQHPVLGYYYLENDGVDDYMVGGLSMTVQLPIYIAACTRRMDALNGPPFGIYKSSTGYVRATPASGRIDGTLREPTIGQVSITGHPAHYAPGRADSYDTLSSVGVTDVCIGRRLPNVGANLWLPDTQMTLCTPGIFATSTNNATGALSHFIAAVCMLGDPGAHRPGIRAYLANLAQAD